MVTFVMYISALNAYMCSVVYKNLFKYHCDKSLVQSTPYSKISL